MIGKITWLSQKDMAKKLGVCVNTFKTHYRPKYPPNEQRGSKLYWSADYAENIIKELTSPASPPQYQPTTA